MTAEPRTIDVSSLPQSAFGHRSLMWWGTMGMIAIEGTVFALLVVSYLYLQTRSPEWPPGTIPPPALKWGTLNTVVLLVSAIPNLLAKRAAERMDLRNARLWMVVCLGFGLASCVVRAFEFPALNTWWDQNAYGSVVWMLLGSHTVHIATDVFDSIVLAVLLFTGPVDESRLVDVSENALYWYFVILAWLPIYGLIYFAPRW